LRERNVRGLDEMVGRVWRGEGVGYSALKTDAGVAGGKRETLRKLLKQREYQRVSMVSGHNRARRKENWTGVKTSCEGEELPALGVAKGNRHRRPGPQRVGGKGNSRDNFFMWESWAVKGRGEDMTTKGKKSVLWWNISSLPEKHFWGGNGRIRDNHHG